MPAAINKIDDGSGVVVTAFDLNCTSSMIQRGPSPVTITRVTSLPTYDVPRNVGVTVVARVDDVPTSVAPAKRSKCTLDRPMRKRVPNRNGQYMETDHMSSKKNC